MDFDCRSFAVPPLTGSTLGNLDFSAVFDATLTTPISFLLTVFPMWLSKPESPPPIPGILGVKAASGRAVMTTDSRARMFTNCILD